MTDEFPLIRKNSIALAISREMAIDHGLVQATPEEVARRNEEGERFHAEQRALREAWLPIIKAMHATPGLVSVMLDLHRPDLTTDYSPYCPGCPGGEENWPCITIEHVAAWCRVELPSRTLPGKRYEEEWEPWDGKPFVLPRPESFVTLDPNDIGGCL